MEPLPGRELKAPSQPGLILGPLITFADRLGPPGKRSKPQCPHASAPLEGCETTGDHPREGSSGPGTQKYSVPGSHYCSPGPRLPRPGPLSPSRTHIHSPSAGAFHSHIQSGRLLLGAGGEPEELRVELLENVF